MNPYKAFLISFFFIGFTQLIAQNKSIEVISNASSPMVDFGVTELVSTLEDFGYEVSKTTYSERKTGKKQVAVLFCLADDPLLDKLSLSKDFISGLEPEGFVIEKVKNNKTILVGAKDPAGLMYGGLELAEMISIKGIEESYEVKKEPYMKMRGTKFNIPLDVRTPSYSDMSDAAQNNIAGMWSIDFWKEYIDHMARYRYNFISLWSLHPFPSLVKVPEYPDIALDDVHQSTVKWKEYYDLNGWGFDAPEIIDNYRIVKKITIDEKIEFWRKVMRYGKSRNIDFYFITWNIFTYGINGKYGITDELDNPVTRDYFRKSVKQMFITYPDLKGIGLTTGENMYGHSSEVKEEWAFDTYGKGTLDAAALQPDREITFIHRQHQTGALDVASKFKPLTDAPNINFIFSFKYAKAHVYSSINQVYHQEFVKDIRKEDDLNTIWTLRNDDIYYFRWGAPDYVREFIKNIPYELSEGYYYGSDQYIWGREFLNRNLDAAGELEIVKHWYHWTMWGRLGYDPAMSDERFIGLLENRFGLDNGKNLFEAWQHSSMVYPIVTGFHWGALDFQWYIESSRSRPEPAGTPSGYHDINRFITLPPHKGTDYISIPDYVDAKLQDKEPEGMSPLEVADKILWHAGKALGWAIDQHPSNQELFATINDIRSIAYMGYYYAHKIKAATYISLFRKTNRQAYNTEAIDHLKQSAAYWRAYAANSFYLHTNPLWTNRVGNVDWKKNYEYVLHDLTSNGGDLKIPSLDPTPGGKILEAEDALHELNDVKSEGDGFTGSGYLESSGSHAKQHVLWEYNSNEDGIKLLEIRYSLKGQEPCTGKLIINGESTSEPEFWQTGHSNSWVWLKENAKLKKGINKIAIETDGDVLFDHLNILEYPD